MNWESYQVQNGCRVTSWKYRKPF